ncbi:Hydroxymethylglutaryl-CoA lyase [Paramyrothecium foliicola]|nr:Hydroxymethylglutaryl-CoA lyase [Paramyrothecium foliicola]
MSPAVRIVEVGPRDGLQNIAHQVPTAQKVQLIQKLHDAGLKAIEVTSIVSPKAVPQLRDCRDVLRSHPVQALLRDKTLRLPVLTPNIKGVTIAREHNVSEVAIFISATEGFSKANINCTVADSLVRARLVAQEAISNGMLVRGYLSCIFADPFDGLTDPQAVLRNVKELLAMGCYEVSLGDTLGIGSPHDVRSLIELLRAEGVPIANLAGHFHDTYGQALANVWQAYLGGIRVFDSSVAGLGGCPFAPGAKGNVATEDLVYMFDRAGVPTGVNLAKLVQTGAWISDKLGKATGSRAGMALAHKIITKKVHDKRKRLVWAPISETEGLLVHKAGVNLKITMNRPRNGNALTSAMIADLISIFEEAADDDSIKRIAITGKGKFFCTGMDLSASTPVGSGEKGSNAQFDRLTRLFEVVESSSKVTIACLNGPAFGGGVGLTLSCDLRLCAKNATIALTEAKLGLCPATISKCVVRELGISLAREAMLTARPLSPQELHARGIVAGVADDPLELLESFLSSLSFCSPDASRMCKELAKAGWKHAGQKEQDVIVKNLFKEMMKPNAPGAFGVTEFQAGRKVIWDNYKRDKPVSKL